MRQAKAQSQPVDEWNIIWQVDPNDLLSCIERDWFYEISSLVPMQSAHVDYDNRPLLQLSLPNSIVCASCPNQVSSSDLIGYLKRLSKPRVLYHMSDEAVKVGAELYEHCELAIRNGSANFDMVGDRKFMQIPLGYVTGLRNASGVFPKSSFRRYSFAFLGTMKNDREKEMLPALLMIPGRNLVRKTRSFTAAIKYFGKVTAAIYSNAVFVPNPQGNWNPECNRLYDALEWGCIPLIKRYFDFEYQENYHDRLLGDHPIPTFDDWKAAANFARNLLLDPTALDVLQAKISVWWVDYKSNLQKRLAEKIATLIT
jgi:hypothetical protein